MTDLPKLEIEQEWSYLLTLEGRPILEQILPDYLPRCRWFQSKARRLEKVRIADAIPMEEAPTELVFLGVTYTDEYNEVYLLPMKFVTGRKAENLVSANPIAAIARLRCFYGGKPTDGYLIDSVYDSQFREGILYAIEDQSELQGVVGEVDADTTSAFEDLHESGVEEQSQLMGREQSNTSIRYGDKLILKVMRKLESGISPELDIGRFLTEETAITHVPLLAGFMEYRRGRRAPITLAVLQGFVPNNGDAWSYTLDWLGQWLQSGVLNEQAPSTPNESFVQQAQRDIPEDVRQRLGDYLDSAKRLGERTAELHVALASGGADHFRPEPFTLEYQQSLYEAISAMADRNFGQLRQKIDELPAHVQPSARRVLDQEPDIRAEFGVLRERVIPGMRIRGHGDYHLGQVLFSEGDFVIVDFEGEPARALSDRYVKHSPLRDVAGMLRSFHYAAYGVLPGFGLDSVLSEDQLEKAEPWTQYWLNWTSVAFLKAYLEGVAQAGILPPEIADVDLLLQILVTEKAVYELGYELNNRPNWLKVPAQAIASSKVER